jgi:ABC-type nitrate/sulfonate/bicarbonate transport system permease component
MLGLSRILYNATDLLLESLRPIPASALLPVALLLFGLGDNMTISVIAYAVVWPVLISTIEGVRSVDQLLIDTGRIYGLKSKQLIKRVILPATLPSIVTGMRISIALSVTLVIVVEMLVGDKGLGHRIIDAERTFRFPEMYGLIGVIGLLGYCTNKAFIWLTEPFLSWHRESHGQEVNI